ncbi:hypothetical protein [Pseudalkalibacillus caeni]|nr:hypothetical protein [Pseudalkalibacillus caeni]
MMGGYGGMMGGYGMGMGFGLFAWLINILAIGVVVYFAVKLAMKN